MTVPQTDTEQQEFEMTYQALVEEAFGTSVVPVPDLIPLDDQLIQNAQQGDVPHRGRMHQVTPIALDPTEDATIQASARKQAQRLRLPALVLMIAAPLLLSWVLLSVLFPSAPTPVTGRGGLTPTAMAGVVTGTITPGTPALPPAPTVAAGFVTVAGQPLPDVRPTTLEIAGRSFLVYVAPVKDGNWQVVPDPNLANWLPGASTNWCFGLFLDRQPDATVVAWLAQVQPGVPATLRVSSDSRPHLFRIETRREIARTQTEFLDPHQPGLTVVIKTQAGADTRLLLQGVEQIAGASAVTRPTPPEGR